MKKVLYFALAAFTAFSLVACIEDKDDPQNPDNPGTDQPENPQQPENPEQPGDQMTTLCINEVCGVVGSKGIELYNPTDAAVDLEGVAIYKNEATDPTWTGEAGNSIPAKGFWVITSKKEFDDISDVANAKAQDSFSPSKSLLLVLKDKNGNELDKFDRGWAKANNSEIALPTAEGSFARTDDAKKEWKVLAITMGKTNKGAEVKGDIIDVAE